MATYVHKNDQQLGPFDDWQILTCLRDGTFSYEDMAWREGWQNWQPLHTVFPAPSRQSARPDTHLMASDRKAKMKVTTQRTSKPIKLITAIGVLLVLVGVVALMAQQEWALFPLLGGAMLWAVGRIAKWFAHE